MERSGSAGEDEVEVVPQQRGDDVRLTVTEERVIDAESSKESG